MAVLLVWSRRTSMAASTVSGFRSASVRASRFSLEIVMFLRYSLAGNALSPFLWCDTMDELFSKVPPWVLRPLPINAELDAALHKRIDAQARKLPDSLALLHRTLQDVRRFREYDAAANRAS